MTEPTRPNDAAWFVARILAYRMDALSLDDARRFESLRESDEACAERWRASATEPDDPETGHVPAAILAGWPESLARLGALERDLVSRHVAECTACRDDLARAGIPYGANRTLERPSLRWGRLAAAALATVATAAALLLVLRPTPTELPVLEFQMVRGSGTNTLVLPDGASTALLRLPPPDELGLAADDRLIIDVLGPDGARVGHDAGPASSVTMPHAIRLGADGPLPLGEYRIVMAGRPDTLRFRISGPLP